MTPEQEEHLRYVKEDFPSRADAKYREGQTEHGGDLWRKNIVPLLDEEVTNFNIYWPTLREQIQILIDACKKVALFSELLPTSVFINLRDALSPFLNNEADTPESIKD